ncbi:MAG: hypothetical protein E7474_12325 [Ruminococcaceae bacterium]|nr:hypothetical protein [Oscillospiraceae bacterium]
MDIPAVKACFDKVREHLSGLDIESIYMDGIGDPQVGETLRIRFPVTQDGNVVITELMVTSFLDDLDLMLMYSTVVVKIGDRYDELVQKLVPWNMNCPFGAYGIYEEGRQLYHKYSFPFPSDADPSDVAGQVMVLLGVLHQVLSEKYYEAESYSVE